MKILHIVLDIVIICARSGKPISFQIQRRNVIVCLLASGFKGYFVDWFQVSSAGWKRHPLTVPDSLSNTRYWSKNRTPMVGCMYSKAELPLVGSGCTSLHQWKEETEPFGLVVSCLTYLQSGSNYGVLKTKQSMAMMQWQVPKQTWSGYLWAWDPLYSYTATKSPSMTALSIMTLLKLTMGKQL
jgi:hypothetical protein